MPSPSSSEPLARARVAPQNPHMRIIVPWSVIAVSACMLAMPSARADDVLYRCEADSGISLQGTPCPKGVAQRKIPIEHPIVAEPTPAKAPTPPVSGSVFVTPATPATPATALPVAPSNAMHGPNDPYPLWVCMRSDGSTFDSRTGIPGKQWVANPDQPEVKVDSTEPAKVGPPAKRQLIVRPIEETKILDDRSEAAGATAAGLPPAGAVAGQWVPDQCAQLGPQQACDRFASRRDALRKQIYAATPSERATYAPEEQDLTAMLFAACGGR
jgi:hypothetical protein